MIKILATAEYKLNSTFPQPGTLFWIYLFLPGSPPCLTWAPHCLCLYLLCPTFPFYCGALGCGNQGIFLNASQNI